MQEVKDFFCEYLFKRVSKTKSEVNNVKKRLSDFFFNKTNNQLGRGMESPKLIGLRIILLILFDTHITPFYDSFLINFFLRKAFFAFHLIFPLHLVMSDETINFIVNLLNLFIPL